MLVPSKRDFASIASLIVWAAALLLLTAPHGQLPWAPLGWIMLLASVAPFAVTLTLRAILLPVWLIVLMCCANYSVPDDADGPGGFGLMVIIGLVFSANWLLAIGRIALAAHHFYRRGRQGYLS